MYKQELEKLEEHKDGLLDLRGTSTSLTFISPNILGKYNEVHKIAEEKRKIKEDQLITDEEAENDEFLQQIK